MFNALYEYFANTLFALPSTENGLYFFLNKQINIFDVPNLTMRSYLSLISSLICVIFIFVLCCLFVYKIIKLVGGLIR